MDQPRNFKQRDCGNPNPLLGAANPDRFGGRLRDFLHFVRQPNGDMGIQENHDFFPPAITSHSSGENTGDSISPTTLSLPLKKPKMSSTLRSIATSFATG